MTVFLVLLITLGLTIPIVWIVASTIKAGYCATLDARLKMQMIDKGYSPAEIERVLKAGTSKYENDTFCDDRIPRPPIK